MPLVLIIFGVMFLVVAIKGTQGALWTLLKSEFTGSNSFVVWASAIVILGLIGYWKTIRPVTDAGIGLIFLVLLIANKGFFAQFNQAIRNPTAPAAASATPGVATPSPQNLFGPAAPAPGAAPSATPDYTTGPYVN